MLCTCRPSLVFIILQSPGFPRRAGPVGGWRIAYNSPHTPAPATVSRTGEYADRGDYHRNLSPDWEFYPTYLAKLERVRTFLNGLPDGARVLDAGCGEGVLVEEFAGRLAIEGIDPNYSSDRVQRGSLTALPSA